MESTGYFQVASLYPLTSVTFRDIFSELRILKDVPHQEFVFGAHDSLEKLDDFQTSELPYGPDESIYTFLPLERVFV